MDDKKQLEEYVALLKRESPVELCMDSVLDTKLTDVEGRPEEPIFYTLTPVNDPNESEKNGKNFKRIILCPIRFVTKIFAFLINFNDHF